MPKEWLAVLPKGMGNIHRNRENSSKWCYFSEQFRNTKFGKSDEMVLMEIQLNFTKIQILINLDEIRKIVPLCIIISYGVIEEFQ